MWELQKPSACHLYLNTLIENWCLQVVLSLMMSVDVQQKKKVQLYLIGVCLCDGLAQQQNWDKVADAPLSSMVYADDEDSYGEAFDDHGIVFDPLALWKVYQGSQISWIAMEEVCKDWSLQVLMHVLMKQAVFACGESVSLHCGSKFVEFFFFATR